MRTYVPPELIGRAVGLPEDPIKRSVVVVRAQERVVVDPQYFFHEGDFLFGARLLDDDVAVPFCHKAGEPLELRGSPERRLETLPLDLKIVHHNGTQ